jgi:hypothetical protein
MIKAIDYSLQRWADAPRSLELRHAKPCNSGLKGAPVAGAPLQTDLCLSLTRRAQKLAKVKASGYFQKNIDGRIEQTRYRNLAVNSLGKSWS